ncbi:LrgB family protein [Bacillus solimangrovi]|uniref:CidB/LrgB family autolysis modulator n=1 Tax=Bacillus solimangrovi TaxID=1305675 RepID=A0A1E5LCF2_9BACI|nr:LrgB family protein [Bacillus solimangrovi]OEH91770.1 hypothetical protein BFG57_03245 [Bacillus solimangrovi]
MKLLIGLISIITTIVIYFVMKKVYIRFHTTFMVPILTGTISIVLLLLVFNISYDTYMIGGKWIVDMLGPAVVALAIPLYKQWSTIKKYTLPIITGVLIGTVLGIVTGIELSKLLGLESITLYSIVPKSVTSPVAMDIADVIGGNSTLAAIFVMIAGIVGAVLGPSLLKFFRIHHFIGRGIGFGSASHGIGTAKALELGEEEGAISSISMTLSAIFASILSPLLVYILL